MGNLISYLAEAFPPKPKFTLEDIPDLTGKVILVTGGNTGIGYEITKALLSRNAKVYIGCRSEEKAKAAISQLKQESNNEAIFISLDLASLSSVKRAADELKSKETQLHVLFNNGLVLDSMLAFTSILTRYPSNSGVMNPPISKLTTDGFDLQFGTNVIGHFLLTKLLVPLLSAGAEASSTPSRIVNMSSSAQMFVDTINFNAIHDGPARRKMGPAALYMQSKFANVVLSNEFARQFVDQNIHSNSLNPGNLKTDLQRTTPGAFMLFFGWLFSPAPYGALTPLYAGVSPETSTWNGKYLIPWAREGKMRAEAADSKLGQELWDWLEKATMQYA
ncbi:short-chain alcohol dehydrogenase [Stygiomarasmius scandens]|uniref:Short-chain alcohol dehydrogenase n=1 Tax=Marasmiellus scandens TaxID=2682957 RepID=A0ABR1IVW8_9AGAR